MRIAYTGSRNYPFSSISLGYPAPLTPGEIAKVAVHVALTLGEGDEVATGGCSGVDEVVIAAAHMLKNRQSAHISIITYEATMEKSWLRTSAPLNILRLADVRHDGFRYLQRDDLLVEWADVVYAFPLNRFSRWNDDRGEIIVTRGSGTAYTARAAERLDKLQATIPLRES